jgi:hypothetical protein
MPTYSIEAKYEYWVPKPSVDFIEQILQGRHGQQLRALEQRGLNLQQAGEK